MPDGGDIAYIYDGSFEGLLTAVFHAFNDKQSPRVIETEEDLQPMFGELVRTIDTDEALAERVRAGVLKRMGPEIYERLWIAFLSCLPDKATELYSYIRFGFSLGDKARRIEDHLTNSHIMAVNKMSRRAGHEAHLLKGFVRFNELTGGKVYYAKITPDNNVLPILMPHFVDRFGSTFAFVLHDAGRGIAGFYGGADWYIADASGMTLPEVSENDQKYTELWKSFYTAVGIKERRNPRCRMNLCPKKFWPNMPELRGDGLPGYTTRGEEKRRQSAQLAGGEAIDELPALPDR